MPRERLNDRDGIESTLTTHAAEWNNKCRLKFNIKAFDEHSRRELTTGQQRSTPTVHTRSANRLSGSTEPICFFCNESAGSASLHNIVDTNVRRAVLDVGVTARQEALKGNDGQ